MPVHSDSFEIGTKGFSDIIDITSNVSSCVADSGLSSGICLVFVSGSTAGITTIEFESGAVSDLKRALEQLAPERIEYKHNERWHDGNGFSHVRAALTGPGFSVPFQDGRLTLGTWQQIILMCHDNRPRKRRLIVQLTGE
jgi:secondary thiamine-phosphate synthase enzyme